MVLYIPHNPTTQIPTHVVFVKQMRANDNAANQTIIKLLDEHASAGFIVFLVERNNLKIHSHFTLRHDFTLI
jgi:hypothetical protein